MAKVLIIEDDEVIASSMAQHLSGAGFDPVTASTRSRSELTTTW